jgi:hypothetical protein
MDLADAAANFVRSTRHCDNLIVVHRESGGSRAGRRDEEISVNRAIVVLAVAAWQAVVQDLTLACVDLSTPGPNDQMSRATYSLLAGRVRAEVGAFSTPNAQNTRKLLQAAGFDPRPMWAWTQHGGRGKGMVTWSPANADDRIDEWLKLRHAIAHGDTVLPAVSALRAVREHPGKPPENPGLRLVDARDGLAFFRRLARLTAGGLAAHLGVAAPSMR